MLTGVLSPAPQMFLTKVKVYHFTWNTREKSVESYSYICNYICNI